MYEEALPANPLSCYAPKKWPDALSHAFLTFGSTYYTTPTTGSAAITARRSSAVNICKQLLTHYCPPRVGFELHIDTAGSLSATARLHRTIKSWSAASLQLDTGKTIHIIFNAIVDRTDMACRDFSNKEDRAFMHHLERWGGLPMRLLPTTGNNGRYQKVAIDKEEVMRALVVLLVGNVFEFYTFNKETGPRDRLVPWFGGGVVAPVLREGGSERRPTNVLTADEEDMRGVDRYVEAYLARMGLV